MPTHITCGDCIQLICSVIFPPLGVFIKRGCGVDLLINICLTILGYFPGVIHAIYVIWCSPTAGAAEPAATVVEPNSEP